MRFFKYIVLLTLCLSAMPASAQKAEVWQPTGVWPFVNKKFQVATVYVGLFNRSKTIVPCNIHVGKQTLWYSQNDTLMEAIPGSVIRVEFKDGDTYMPVGSEQRFGRIVREDSIDGAIARVICVLTVNQKELDKTYLNHINNKQNTHVDDVGGSLGAMGGAMNSILGAVADAQTVLDPEEEPLPMTNDFYFQVRGDVFPATTKNILSHINPKRKGEYRNFTRSAEIISTNESSMLKIWKEFFLKK